MDKDNINKNDTSELLNDLKLCNLLCEEYSRHGNDLKLMQMLRIRETVIKRSFEIINKKYIKL